MMRILSTRRFILLAWAAIWLCAGYAGLLKGPW